MYGREARLPIDLTHVPPDVAPDKLDFETKIQKMLELQKELHDKVRSNIEKAQAHQKRQYDAKHNTNTKVNVGDKVLVQAMKNQGQKGGKLEPLFPGGPYVIEEDLGKGRFRLKDRSQEWKSHTISIRVCETIKACHKRKKKVEIHCDCRLPESVSEMMAYCPKRSRWYHQSCWPVNPRQNF